MPAKYTEEQFIQKFWERVDKTSDASGCWLWTGCKIPYGHGHVRWKGKTRYTHVVAWLLTGNIIPEGLELAHSGICKGKPHCCNPEHLTPKTRNENQLDRHRDGTMVQAKFNEEEVRQIRRRLAEGETQTKIAKDFNVSKDAISSIKRGRTWSHVT